MYHERGHDMTRNFGQIDGPEVEFIACNSLLPNSCHAAVNYAKSIIAENIIRKDRPMFLNATD